MSESKTKTVVFDMGGVLVELGPISDILGDEEISVNDFWRGWLRSPTVRHFERGRCTPEYFGSELVKELGLSMSGEELIERFASWPKGLFPGAQDLLLELKSNGVPFSVLSNTNVMHWETQTDHEIIAELFDRVFTSYSLDMVKPDAIIFEHVIAELAVEPAQILFVDDNQPNIDAALALGIDAVLTKGVDQVRAALAERGLVGGVSLAG